MSDDEGVPSATWRHRRGAEGLPGVAAAGGLLIPGDLPAEGLTAVAHPAPKDQRNKTFQHRSRQQYCGLKGDKHFDSCDSYP